MPGPYDGEVRASVPPYLRVAGLIRDQIEGGELLPGEQIPSITALAREHGISTGTARRVQQTLRDWGLVVITPGWGVFVAERPGG